MFLSSNNMADDAKHGSSGSVEFTSRFNATNAKFAACIVVIGFIVYHGLIHLTYGMDSCKWLLSDGRFQGYRVWQPYGCMMHTYSTVDTRMCMRYIAYWGGKTHVVFVGDSRIRQLFNAFVSQIDTKYEASDRHAHHTLTFSDKDLKVDAKFIWSPMINHSMFEVYEKWLSKDSHQHPSVVVTGSATWSIKTSNASMEALESYKRNLTQLVPLLDRMKPTTKILWVLQDPVVPEKLQPSRMMITNEQIDLYNKAAMDILRYSSVHIWSSSRLVSQGYNHDQEDGLHMGQVALNYAVQILLNMYCNDHMNYNDGSCCSSPEHITTLQIITFSAFGVCCLLAISMVIHRKLKMMQARRFSVLGGNCHDVQPKQVGGSSWYELFTSLGRLGIILAYFYLCDRTNFFMKENKYYTHLNFFLPLAYVFVLGLFFTEESQYTQVLHRDQTNEWKGWMQLVILIYHMTGASQVLPIYMHIRVLVTSYLFLSGYGHFTYFWHTGDYGLYRVWQRGLRHFPAYWRFKNNPIRRVLEVLFRLNLLGVVLCLCMNRPYQFYYFVPLVSFWFLVIFLTMASIPQVTSNSADANPLHYLYMVLKFVGLFSVVTILYMSEVFFEKIFVTRPWKALFVTTDDSIKEWWFRWKIDRYGVAFGMLFAFAYHLMKQYRILDDNNHGNLFSRSITLTATSASFIGIGIYATFAFLCRNKPECNEVHPYISFVPIISYVTLRNISGLLRTRYSTFFAWFGKISLELFIAQYHLWLAADTHGVLVLVPGYPVLNVMVTSFIFVCVAHEIHLLTHTLVKYAIPSDWRYLIRNVVIFFLVLVPIGIHDGMF